MPILGGTTASSSVTLADRGAWATSTAYAVGDVVTQSSVRYVCKTAHTAGTFATDLAAQLWTALDPGAAVPLALAGQTPSQAPVGFAGTAAVGSLAVAARADHVHPAAGLGGQNAVSSGQWTFPLDPASGATSTVAWGRLFVSSFVWNPYDGSTPSIVGAAVRVITAGDASSLLRLGLYQFGSTEPSVLLADFGTVDGATTGIKALTFAGVNLPAGRYGFAVCLQRATTPTTAAQVAASANATPWGSLTHDDTNRDQVFNGTLRAAYFLDGAFTSGALPSSPSGFSRANQTGVTFALKAA